jgi:4-hydroxythreonine-4-phosphate dehydrogenase
VEGTVSKLLALTLGDRYGVGPELVARFVAGLPSDPGVRIVVIGDRAVFERGRADVGVYSAYVEATGIVAAAESDAPWVFLHRPFDAEVTPLGRVSTGATGEINILGDLWTSRVTSHVPLRAVADLITRESVMRGIRLMAETLQRAGKTSPRIAVAALNPHAGEGGAFGMEEIEVIGPAIAEAQASQFRVEGPFPSDTIFPRAMNGGFDGVVTMFHDQGQIALKLVGLGQGITLLAGFPVPIATPGHGTAYDIAGTGKARIEGLAGAVGLVARMMGASE